MEFSGIQKTTLIDYPGKVATTLFTYGCNFRCPFCHNPELVVKPNEFTITEDEVLEFLKSRTGKVDGVVITGGEPLLHDELKDFIIKVKDLGLLVKVDTNGYSPEKIEELCELVDYWAVDIKNSPEKYSETSGCEVDISKIKKSIKIIMKLGKDYEFRTTVVPGLHDKRSILGVGKLVKGAKRLVVQNFRGGKTIDPSYKNKKGFGYKELEGFKGVLKKLIEEVEIIEN